MRNHYEVQGDVVCINVWHKGSSLCALIDLADLPLLLERKVQWYAQPAKQSRRKYYCYAKLWKPDEKRSITVGLHQLIMGTVGKGKNVQVDHVDNDGLNCRRKNLRVCTQRENLRFAHAPRDWAEYDRQFEARKTRSKYLAAVRQVVEQFAYTRQGIWKIRTGKSHNPAILAAIEQALHNL